jgi:hypothetical protein
VAPNVTAVAPLKLVPVIVTVVPPVVGPAVGEIEVTVGAGTIGELVRSAGRAGPAQGGVTRTSTVPVPAGAVAVIWVALLTVMPVAAVAPNVTAVAPVKRVPVMVTVVPARSRARRRRDRRHRRRPT